MNSPHPSQAARSPRAAAAAIHASAAMMLATMLCATSLLTPTRAEAQSDPKSPRVDPMPATSGTRDLTPHAGMVVAGHVVIGQPAPTFELDGSQGRPVQLASLRGDWTALIFIPRMSDATHLAGTERALRAANIRLVGVCYERARTVESFVARNQIDWLLLADVTGEVGAMYGVWDTTERGFSPGVVLIDPHGIVHDASIGYAFSPDQLRDIVLTAREKT
jgi:peroxiredoxin Q/BCP